MVDQFSIPIKVTMSHKEDWITPTKDWKELKSDKFISNFSIDKKLLCGYKKICLINCFLLNI